MKKGCIGFFLRPKDSQEGGALSCAIASAEKCGFSHKIVMARTDYDSTVENNEFDGGDVDFIVAIGGDGTILRAASTAVRNSLPVLGVNTGRIGFLSEIDITMLDEAFLKLKNGEYTLDEKLMLECSVDGGQKRICLNDVMLYKERFSGVTQIDLEVDGKCAGKLSGDGLVVATPTGATGYSISAGGPVVAPGLDVMLITPICQHSLTMRPIVTSMHSNIKFTMQSDGFLSLDGMFCETLEKGSEIVVGAYSERAKFVTLGEKNLFTLIKNKLS
ncbi:MAG: NAD(+)/NADH kinase [Clostridia bacterium]|nr:NAD(+)/NADH kinase [Clostridia bacterium]